MIDRRRCVLTVLACAACGLVLAQPAKPPVVIGFLRIVPPSQEYVAAFEQGLSSRGYAVGRDLLIDARFGNGRQEHLDALARDMVARKVAIIVAAGNQAVRSARKATETIPIIMAVANDPIASGFVSSLARPGGNITGTTLLSSTLAGKRLELLTLLLPKLSRAAVLLHKNNPAHAVAWKETQLASAKLGLEVQPFEVQGLETFDAAFAAMGTARSQGLVLFEDATFATARTQLAALAARARLPTIFGQRNSVEDGGLMSYGPSIEDAYRNAGSYVDRILKGAAPAELPVEQPTRFELVVNLKTARSLGLTVPQSLLLRADEVIQ